MENSQASNTEDDMVCKIVAVGDACVGKTSLYIRYKDNCFTGDYPNTIMTDLYIKSIKTDGKQIKLMMVKAMAIDMKFDLGGYDGFRGLKLYYGRSHGVLAEFDLTNKESFERVGTWIKQCEDMCGGDITKVLVGNKADLESKREVSHDVAKEFADQLGIPYIETSAKTGVNVEEVFMAMATLIKKRVDNGTLELPKPTIWTKFRQQENKQREGWICS